MKIRDRLSLFFTMVSSVNLLIVMILIYSTFYSYLQADFFKRLKGRVNVAMHLYVDPDKQSPDKLAQVRKEFSEKIPGEVIRIYDESNNPVFIADKDKYWPDNIINEVRENGKIEYADKERFIVGEFFNNYTGNYIIIASAQYPDRIRKLTEFIIFMVLIFLISLVLIFGIGRWFSQKTLSPINKLIDQLQRIDAQSLNRRVTARHENDEIGLLARNFNKFLTQMEESFELQKAFIVNASHELRTPITTIIGEAEVSLKQERTAGEYQELIRSILVESEKLNDTVSGVIDIAQIDVNFVRAIMEPVRIDDLIWELQEYWAKKLHPNALLVTMNNLSDNESPLIIQGNKALLNIALNNIIGNAFKFSGGQPVKCILQVKKGSVQIKVVDKGIGIKPENKEKIFEAFFRSERSSGFPGTGIGLYVTDKVVQLMKGSIEVVSQPDSGTTMILHFRNVDSDTV